MYEYVSFMCGADVLERHLNGYGKDNWRLHTCEPITRQLRDGSLELLSFVVMDRIVISEEEQAAAEGPGAMGMVG